MRQMAVPPADHSQSTPLFKPTCEVARLPWSNRPAEIAPEFCFCSWYFDVKISRVSDLSYHLLCLHCGL